MKTQEIIDAIVGVCESIQRAEYRLLGLIRELDQCKGWAQFGMQSCAHWLNYQCGMDLVTAREKVRVAHALVKLTEIREAFRDGRLSYSKVRAITRVATGETEAELVAAAEAMTAAHVEQLVKRYRQAERLEESRTAFTAHRHRSFSCHYDEDGSLVFEGRLRFLQKSPEDDEGFRSADRYQVVIHASAEALPEYGPVDHDDPRQVQDGPVVATETVRRITCDCGFVPILETSEGEPLNIGRKARVISAAIYRALKRRDRGCRFPGCVNSRFVDGHHIHHWADGVKRNSTTSSYSVAITIA